MSSDPVRRPLKTRQARWAHALARGAAGVGLRPNGISVLSVPFAAATGWALLASRSAAGGALVGLFAVAAVTIQLRLLCNLLDGLVAVEGGFRSPAGEVFNDLPDRVSDLLTLVPAGYATGWALGPELGWAAGVLAVLTAYVRVLGGACGLEQRFTGPMAKPHRMAAMTVGLALAAGLAYTTPGAARVALAGALAVVAVGSAATAVRRTWAVTRELGAAP